MKSKIPEYISIAILALCALNNARAGDVVVISNTGVTLSTTEVKDVFLGEKQFAGSTKLIVIDNKSAQDDFLARFMKMDASKYNSLWTKKSFRDGLNPPAIKSSDAEVIEFVKQTPGAVGYVTGSPSGVNIAH